MKCNIGKLRKDKGLLQKYVAKQIGISSEYLSKIENNKSEPTVTILWAIAKILDCKVDDLYTFGDEQ